MIFSHFCHFHLACRVFALFSRLSFYQGHLSGILFNFRYLVIFCSDLPFSPFWSRFGIIFWSLISICVNPLVIFPAKFTTFHPPDWFSPFATRIHRPDCIRNMDQVLRSASACLHKVVWIGGMRPNGKPFDKIYLSGIRSEKCR